MDQEKIGNLIKNIRIEHNLTQKELADKLGVTFQAVSKWERGQNIPDIQQLKAICDLYNLDIKEFVDGNKSITKKDNKIKYIIGGLLIVILAVVGLIIYFAKPDGFDVYTISGEACDLIVQGNAANASDHTSIFITSVKYCGPDKKTIYKKINCMLYQVEGNVEIKLVEKEGNNITIDDFLEDITFNVDSHKTTCSNLTKSSLTMILDVTDENDKVTTYKVPLDLEDSCK